MSYVVNWDTAYVTRLAAYDEYKPLTLYLYKCITAAMV